MHNMNIFRVGVVVALLSVCYCKDLYQVLGVTKSATESEIRTAYKRLAKRWHPDKNSSPKANEKFIQINEAYEVLSDKKRRHNYDNGQTQDGSFTMFHKNFFFTGHHRNTINAHQYRLHIIPQSYHKPFLMYFYHDFCLPCIHVSGIWDQLKKELVGVEVGMVTVNVGVAVSLAQHVGVTYAPAVAAVSDGRLYHFTGTISVTEIKKFLKTILPNVMVLTDVSLFQQFISEAINRNRPRLIVCSSYSIPSLHVLLNAKRHRQFIDFGYVSLSDDNSVALSSWLGLSKYIQTAILIYKEQSTPVFSVKSGSIAADRLQNTAMDNRLLILPRLTSPEHFSLLCPMETTKERCVFLVVPDNQHYNNSAVAVIRQLATINKQENIHFGIIDASKQAGFLSNFNPIPLVSCLPYYPVLIMQHHHGNHVNYEWQSSWCGELLLVTISEADLTCTANLHQLLVNEEAPGLLKRWFSRFTQMWDDVLIFFSLLEMEAIIPLISVIIGMLIFTVFSFFTGPTSSDQSDFHQFTASLYQQRVVDNVTNNHVLVVLLQINEHFNVFNEELISSYGKVAKHYCNLLKESLVFSIGRPCHHEWYCRLLTEANMEYMVGKLDEIDAVAIALYSKKKAVCFAHFKFPSTLENLLGLETSSTKSVQDQMTMWLDRILDGTAEKKYLNTWPTV